MGYYRTIYLKKLDMQFPKLLYGGNHGIEQSQQHKSKSICNNFEIYYRTVLLCEYYADFFISQQNNTN